MIKLQSIWLHAFQIVSCEVSVNAKFFIFHIQNSFYMYLVLFLLHRIGNSLAYVADFIVASVCKLSELVVSGSSISCFIRFFSSLSLKTKCFIIAYLYSLFYHCLVCFSSERTLNQGTVIAR